MSLPLPRRFAQAALLVGAAAAPLIGAGAAHAAAPHQQDLGGLTNVDGAGLGNAVDGASQKATGLAAQTGTDAMKTTLPATGRIVGTTGRTAAPAAQRTAGQATDAAGRLVGATAESAGGAVPGAETLPTAAVPNAGALPSTGMVADQLPLKGLPLT